MHRARCHQVPAKWVGSGATIALVPKTCLIYPDQKTLACSPAKLVLITTAGKCVASCACMSSSLHVCSLLLHLSSRRRSAGKQGDN